MRCFWKWPYLKFAGKLLCSIIWEICLKYDFRWWTWENSPVSVLLVVIYMIFWSSSHKMKREKIFFDSSFKVVIIIELIMESRKSVMALKYVHFFHKILTGGLSLVRKSYSWKSKIYGHDSWTWEFSFVSNKEDIGHSCFIFVFEQRCWNSSFYIILIWKLSLFGRYTLKISVRPIFDCMQTAPLKNLNLRL